MPVFEKDIPNSGKAAFEGGEFKYRPELNAIKEKIELLIATDKDKDPLFNFKVMYEDDLESLKKAAHSICTIVRPLLIVIEKDGKSFVSAEIPGVDLSDRPVFYKGKGRLKGSYTRVGDSDEPMTEYEVYSYEAYRKKYQDDIRGVQRATLSSLNQELIQKQGCVRIGQIILLLQSERQLLMHWFIAIIVFIQKACQYKLLCMKTGWK